MELSLKLPKDKPPFIGIVFESEREACTLNRDLLGKASQAHFKINLEPFAQTLHLRLMSDNPVGIRFYKYIKYDPQRLEAWLHHTKFSKKFNFSHLIRDKNKEVVVKTTPDLKLFVLKIDEVTIYN